MDNFSQHCSFIHGSQETTLLLYSIQYYLNMNSDRISLYRIHITSTPDIQSERDREREAHQK